MKIAYLAYSAIPSRAANSVQVMRMCQALAKAGHDVTLYASRGKETVGDLYRYYGVEQRFEVVWLNRQKLAGFGEAWYGWRVARALQARGLPDLLYARDIWSLAAAAGVDRPMILESHTPPRKWIGKTLQAWVLRHQRFTRLVVISRALRQDYLRLYPWLRQEQIVVAPDGADVPSGGDQAAAEHPGVRRNGRLQLGYVGHLYPGRGIDLIVRLAERLPDVDVHLVGGTERDLAHWRDRTKGTENLHWHGHVAPAEVGALRQAMDILLSPYQRTVLVAGGTLETSRWMPPLKIFEYMAAKKAIIASDLPALREVLSPNVNALMPAPEDLDGWVAAVEVLRRNPGLRQRLAAQAFEDVRTQFLWERRVEKVLADLAGETGGNTGRRR